MDELLNFPKLDPHGSPIPDKNGKIEIINYKKLAEFKEGDKVEICAVIGSSDEFLKYLNSKNIHLNDEIEIISVEDFDGTMKVKFLKSNEIEIFSNHVTSRLLGR